MAVSQVERLKNPCRVWTWNSLVASQPPPSAPATPIRQVRTSPCDLLPGISMLASRPAPRPRTIHAMMPITDSSVSNQMTYGVAGPARQVAVGERNSRGLLPFSGPERLSWRRPERKNSGSCAAPVVFTGQLPGSGALPLLYLAAALVSTAGIRQQQAAGWEAPALTWAPPPGATGTPR